MQPEHITVLIPTYNRHQYLHRLTEYYAGSGFQLLVIDSTDQAYGRELPDNVRYLHKPQLPFTDKLVLGSELIETELMAVCADDDFLVPDGIIEAASFLDRNPEYVSCQGLCLTYILPRKDLVVIYPKYQNLLLERIRLDFQSSDSEERVLSHFSPFLQWLYAVHTREAFHTMARLLSGVDPLRSAFVDRTVTLGLAAQGNCKVLPRLFIVREHAPSTTTKDEKFKSLYLSSDQVVQSDVKRLRQHLALNWLGPEADSVDEVFIDRAFETYCDSLGETRAPQKPTVGEPEQVNSADGRWTTLVRHFSPEFPDSAVTVEQTRRNVLQVSSTILRHYSDQLLTENKFAPDYVFDF